ncbi:MAG TPA: hypothetical protein VLY85_01200 [Thermoplasmata archaeon]|nr:hypothetical protein [Thermoplasmata archaeon]
MTDPLAPVIQAILFAIFSSVTFILQTITGPTYEGLVVPELSPGSLFPPLPGGGSSFLSEATRFSEFLVVDLVDPAIVVVALAIGLLYLARSFLGRETARLEGTIPRLIVYIVLSNVSVPVAGALLGLAGAIYPSIAGFDGGAWQTWSNLSGPGALYFSWDNGALAFVVSIALFSLVLLLAAAIALRDALLGVLLVLLPVLTLVGAVPTLRPLTRRAWLLFGEAAFLPCVLVIPLELAVGSPSVLFLLAYLTIALGSPALISVAGTHLSQLGAPTASGVVSGGIQRGLGLASLSAGAAAQPAAEARRAKGSAVAVGAVKASSRGPLPLSVPLAAGDLVGRGAGHLLRHLKRSKEPETELDDPIYKEFPATIRDIM